MSVRDNPRAALFAPIVLAACLGPSAWGADWPQWRHDANRSAASPQALPTRLHLQWVREYPRLMPAWEDPVNQDRMPFDRVYEPVVLGSTMFVASNRSDRVVALDTRTGEERWRVYVDGPVRLPPVAWEGKVYFVSDDGCLHCVRADTGAGVWTLRGGPDGRKVLGNGRMVSAWPARGGPVLANGTLYFAASIWPFMGVFVHAVDAATGKVVWTNDGSGSIFMNQPHGGSVSFAGIAPQGALAVLGDRLLVPCGRSVPACLDRRTGKLLYYHLSGSRYYQSLFGPSRKLEGGSHVSAIGRLFLTHRGLATTLYDAETGSAFIMWQRRTYPVLTPNVCYLSGDRITALDLVRFEKQAYAPKAPAPKTPKAPKSKGKKPAPPKRPRLEIPTLWECKVDATGALIKAGHRLYAGGKGTVSAIDMPAKGKAPTVSWTAQVEGTVARIIAADDRLFVVTLEGRIYAFGADECEPKIHRHTAAGLESLAQASQRARRMLRATTVSKGVCLVYGVKDGNLVEALARQSEFRVVAVGRDAAKVDTLRRRFDDAGLYGTRISMHVGDPTTFGAPPYVAALTAFESLDANDATKPFVAKVYRSMRPYGGAAFFPMRDEAQRDAFAKQLHNAKLPNAQVTRSGLSVMLRREGALPGAADWTHQYGNMANTAKSDDTRVRLPLGVLWFGGNTHHDVLPRHAHGPSEQVMGGRLFIQGMKQLSARDVYTGQVLWRRHLPDLGTFGVYFDASYKPNPLDTTYNQGHIPGANARGTNFVATADKVYLAVGAYCVVFDAATGTTRATFSLPPDPGQRRKPTWSYVGVYGDLLIAGANFARLNANAGIKLTSRTNHDVTSSRRLVVMNRHTGTVLWTRPAKAAFRHNAIAAGAGKLFCIDTLPDPVLKALKRRGRTPDLHPALLALDARTGAVMWQTTRNVFGTWLGYSAEHDILIQSGRHSRDMIAGEPRKRIIAYRGADGSVVWDKPATHSGPCILHGRTIYTNASGSQGNALSLLTGEPIRRKHPLTGNPIPWSYTRFYGCNYVVASEHLLTFRSGAAGYYDLTRDSGTGNLGGFKSGCSANLIAANGVLNAPDYTRTCTCSYQNQTSLALIHMPDVETWTFNKLPKPDGNPGVVRRVGINFGAPGDRRTANGTLWIDYPTIGGPSPDIDVKLDGHAPTYPRRHASFIEHGALPWVAASAVTNATRIRVTLAHADKKPETPLIAAHAQWHYLAGSHPPATWTQPDFQPTNWKTGKAGFGYGDNDDTTVLSNMRGRYTTVYIRNTFALPRHANVRTLALRVRYDDAFIAYLNGHEVLRVGVKKGRGPTASHVASHEAKGADRFEIKHPMRFLRPGLNVLAIEGHNVGKGSSDFSLAPSLVRDWVAGSHNSPTYTVRLHFADLAATAPGQRVFAVSLQGKTVLHDFDIVRAAGGPRRSVVKEFQGVGVWDVLDVRLTPAPGSRLGPSLSGIEIVAEEGPKAK